MDNRKQKHTVLAKKTDAAENKCAGARSDVRVSELENKTAMSLEAAHHQPLDLRLASVLPPICGR